LSIICVTYSIIFEVNGAQHVRMKNAEETDVVKVRAQH